MACRHDGCSHDHHDDDEHDNEEPREAARPAPAGCCGGHATGRTSAEDVSTARPS